MNLKRLLCVLTVVAVLTASLLSITASAAEDFRFSDEYKTSSFYTKLMTALDDNADKTTMEKTLAVALSQEGYKNYATTGINIEEARENGKLWTGTELRMNNNLTGNTEYTRWAQRYVLDRAESTQYEDIDWCAIFVSWCMYQAGYYDKEELKRCYYSYYANPTVSYDADGWILTYNLDQHNVWYTPTAENFLDSYYWNTYYNTEIAPYEIDYKPGGLVFFSWDGGADDAIDHVGIVVSYDKDTHILTYTNGNSDGQVITREMDLDTEEEFRGMPLMQNSKRIAAYGEYDAIKPLEQKEIASETKSIEWDKSATSGIKIQTDSESKICSVSYDGVYLGSTIESNMVLLEGRMAIGRSEMIKIPVGSHTLTLTFDDGVLNIPLKITDGPDEPTAPVSSETSSETDPVTSEASSETEPVSSEASSETEPVSSEVSSESTPTSPVNPKPVVKTPKISAKTAKLAAGKTKTLKVTNGKVKSWTSSKKTVAFVKNGKVTALKKGTATITAKLSTGKKLSCKITVTSDPSIKISGKKLNAKKTYSIKKGKCLTLTLTGKAADVKNSYASSNKKIAKVTSKATATKVKIKGIKIGNATVTVKVNNVAFKIKIKVKKK